MKTKILQIKPGFYYPPGLFSSVSLIGKVLYSTACDEALTGTSFCQTTLKHGTFGQLVCLHSRRCTTFDCWPLRWIEATKLKYSAMPQKMSTERLLRSFNQQEKNLESLVCSKNRLAKLKC